jgi:hypothetical protein
MSKIINTMASLEEAFKITDHSTVQPVDPNVVGMFSATSDPNKPTIHPSFATFIYVKDNGVLYIKESTWFGYYEFDKSVKDGDIITTRSGRYGLVRFKA